MGSSVYAFECLLFNTKNSGNATVIPTFPYSFASFGTTEYNITKFSCGFPTTRVPSKPSFPSYTVLWSHNNPRGTVKPSYTSVGCLFSSQTSQTKTLTKTATASCISSCSMSLGLGFRCTHFNYDTTNAQCTLFNQPGDASFSNSSTGTTCGFMIGPGLISNNLNFMLKKKQNMQFVLKI